jgi:hypothetical protein
VGGEQGTPIGKLMVERLPLQMGANDRQLDGRDAQAGGPHGHSSGEKRWHHTRTVPMSWFHAVSASLLLDCEKLTPAQSAIMAPRTPPAIARDLPAMDLRTAEVALPDLRACLGAKL